MTKEGIRNHTFSKIALSFLLVISMFVPFITAPNAQAAEPITVAEAIANNTGTATVKGYHRGYCNLWNFLRSRSTFYNRYKYRT